MKIPEDQARLKGLLQETITLLCKNGLNYKAEFSVEALIVVTLDKEQMFHTNIKETIAKEGVSFSVETLDSDSEKDGSIVTKSRKYGKKRRKQRDDSMEVPSKRSSSQVYGEESPSITLTEDERQCNSEKQVKDEHDEDSSDSVIIKDEQKKLSENPVPLADLELVDGSEQGSLQYGAGVWNVQDTEQNASMLGGTGDAANQDEASDQADNTGMKLPTRPVTRARQTPEKSEASKQGGTSPRFTRQGKKSIKSGAAAKKTGKETPSLAVVKGKGSGSSVNAGQQKKADEPMEESSEDAEEAKKADAYEWKEDESDQENKESRLKGILQKAIERVRQDLTPNTTTITRIKGGNLGQTPRSTGQSGVVTSENTQRSTSPSTLHSPLQEPQTSTNQATPVQRSTQRLTRSTPGTSNQGSARKKGSYTIATPVEIANLKSVYPDDKVERGRPINPAVTSIMVSAEDDESALLRAAPIKKEIKVISLDADPKPVRFRPKMCQFCGLNFASMQSLADHQCGEKNLFRCGICSAMFMRKENLKRHFEEHRDEVQVEVLATD